jgi:hypothetical protein
MEHDYGQMVLMDRENGRIRGQLFNKSNKPKKKTTTSMARHMTSDENMLVLAREDWEAKMREIFKSDVFRARRDAYEAHCRREVSARKEGEKARKEAEREAERARKEADKAAERARKDAHRAWARECKHAKKVRVQEEKRQARENAKAAKADRTPAAKHRRATAAAATIHTTRTTRTTAKVSDDAELEDPDFTEVETPPHSHPQGVQKAASGILAADDEEPPRRSKRGRMPRKLID